MDKDDSAELRFIIWCQRMDNFGIPGFPRTAGGVTSRTAWLEADRQRAAMNDEAIQKAVRETAERCILISNQYRNMGSNIPGASKGMFLAAESISAKIAGQFLSAKPEKTKEG